MNNNNNSNNNQPGQFIKNCVVQPVFNCDGRMILIHLGLETFHVRFPVLVFIVIDPWKAVALTKSTLFQ